MFGSFGEFLEEPVKEGGGGKKIHQKEVSE